MGAEGVTEGLFQRADNPDRHTAQRPGDYLDVTDVGDLLRCPLENSHCDLLLLKREVERLTQSVPLAASPNRPYNR